MCNALNVLNPTELFTLILLCEFHTSKEVNFNCFHPILAPISAGKTTLEEAGAQVQRGPQESAQVPQCASHLTTMLSSAQRLLLQREGPCDGIPTCGQRQRAQGPTGLTPQSSGPLLCTQSGGEWLPRVGGSQKQETNEQC